jgi:hypothetical protein
VKALIDADYLRYNIGFSGETTEYVVVDTGEGDKEVARFRYHHDMKEWILENDRPSYAVTKEITVAPLEFILGRVKTEIQKIIAETKATEYTLYLSGKDNFRDALVDDYKANRDPDHKPKHYAAIGEYLIKHWGAVVVDGIEADDAMGLAQTGHDTIICTIDKDLDGVPGWHYWVDRGPYHLTGEEAIAFFYQQLLSGDSTDNIDGLPGIGTGKAGPMVDGINTEKELFLTVASAYCDYYGEEAYPLIMDQQARLLWMQRQGRVDWLEGIDPTWWDEV